MANQARRSSFYRSKSVISVLFTLFILTIGCASYTPEYTEPNWKKKGITSLEKIELNGVSHSVLVRGTDKNNPLLVIIHGYGIPMMPFAHLDYPDPNSNDPYLGAMEKRFIIVHYDQRGVGKTAREATPENSYTLSQYVDDAEALVAEMRRRYNKDKVYILGISWGSFIGMKLVEKRPEWIHAFFSEGQAVNTPESYSSAARFALSEATKEDNEEAIRELSEVKSPSPLLTLEENTSNSEIILKWADHYQQKLYPVKDLSGFFIRSLFGAPEYSFMDALATLQAIESFTKNTFMEQLSVDLRNDVPAVKVPVYFLMGEYDPGRDVAKEYFQKLNAPKKEWIEIPEAGHSASADQPQVYLEEFLKRFAGGSDE